MKTISTAAVLAAATLLVAQPAFAQSNRGGTVLVPEPSAKFEVSKRSRESVAASFNGAMQAVQWNANKYAELSVTKDIDRMTRQAVIEATPTVEWTGQGVLYEIRVATNPADAHLGNISAILVDSKAWKVGVGATPEQALYSSYEQGAIKPGLTPGYVIDPAWSTYFWVARGIKGQITSLAVSDGTIVSLKESVQRLYVDQEYAYQTEKASNTAAWVQIAQTASTKLQQAKAKRDIQDALKTVLASQERVAKINAHLRDAMDRAARAANTYMVLSSLRTVLDFASLARSAIQEMNVPAQRFEGVESSDGVLRVVNEIKVENITQRRELEIQFKGEALELQNAFDGLWNRVQPAKPPVDVKPIFDLKLY